MDVVKEEVEAGRMEGVDLSFPTDNSVVEDVYYQGNSSNKGIFELILRLVYLELMVCFRLNVIWLTRT